MGFETGGLGKTDGDKHVGETRDGFKTPTFWQRSVKYLILGTKRTNSCLKIDHIPSLSLAIAT